MKRIFIVFLLSIFSGFSFAGPDYVHGQITSLMGHGTDPAIRINGTETPDDCDGGPWGWLYFSGTPEERNRVYASALALSLAGKAVSVYTNYDGAQCRIVSIQITGGLN